MERETPTHTYMPGPRPGLLGSSARIPWILLDQTKLKADFDILSFCENNKAWK